MPLKYVPVDGVATLVHHRGSTTLPGHSPSTELGAPILCLHDAGGNGHVFGAVLDALAGEHSPIAFDQPGHGRSGTLDSLGAVDRMAAHARALADKLGLSAPVLLGDGLGAAVALELAIEDPSWPRALVLAGGATARFDLPEEALAKLQRVVAGKARREFDASGYAKSTGKDVYQRAFGEWIKTDPRALLGDRLAQREWSAEGRLAKLTCPVLVIVGEHEDGAAADALGAALANARVERLPGAARRGVEEQPAVLAERVVEFLAEAMP